VPGITLVLATVYLRHHYVIDIIAGFVLAIAVYLAAPSIDRAWTRLREQGAPEASPGGGARGRSIQEREGAP
jgi:membrane-associated phospholipid phosphatase